jgi:rhamnosyltransferase subunit B
LLWALERSLLDRVCAPEINSFRAELGLPPVKRVMSRWIHSPQGVLGLYPDWFAPIQSDWPAGFELTGFPLFDQADLRDVDDELEDFLASGPAPIVFTPGSTLVDELSYYRAAEAALNALGGRGIFLASRCKALSERKRNILVRPYVPLSRLLPRARALVHHGGIGTASLALAAGVPQLITPFVFDQFDNAARVERLGCGFQIGAHASGSIMAQSLKLLLDNDRIRQHCTTVQAWTDPGEVACMKALSAVEAFAARTLGSGGSGASVGPEERDCLDEYPSLEDIFGRGW